MSRYVFYTGEGYTSSPNGCDVENYQILGFEEADSKERAEELLIEHNSWILECGYSISAIESMLC